MLALAIPLGLLIGLSLGALGGGGSILTVPALVYLLHQSPHAATAGSLLIVGVTAVAGAAAHWHAGRVRVGQGLTFGILGIAGAYVGSRLSATVDPNTLLAGFAVLMLVAAAAMLRRTTAGAPRAAPSVPAEASPGGAQVSPAVARRAADGRPAVAVLERPATAARPCNLPSPSARVTTCRAIKIVAAASVVGLLTGFFGVGGGFVIVPVLVIVLGFEMPVAVGTSLLVIALNSAVALAARVGTAAHLDWTLLGVFAAVAIVGSVIGNRIASRVDAARLTTAFTVLLVVVALYTGARSLPHVF